MHYFKNRFFLIVLTAALCLTVFSVVLSASGHAWFLKDALNVISTPIRAVFNYCADGFRGFTDYFTEFDRIAKENEELRAENDELKRIQSEIEVLKEENAWFREFLEIKNFNTSFEFADATVIGRSSGAVHSTVTINRGSLHGIEVGMVVINGDGVVGRVSEIGLVTSEVICITDISSSVGALIERSALLGIVEGYSRDSCRFLYTTGITDLSTIEIGDSIITSGKGSIYPYGLKIGVVTDIKLDDASRSVIATVEPYVDIDEIDRVMIIKSFSVE